MQDRMQHQIEFSSDTATLYVTGELGYEHVDTLIRVCDAAPSRTRMLRVDLHGLGPLGADALGAVRQLLHFWRDSRRGEVRLATSHPVATLHEVRNVREPRLTQLPDWRRPPLKEATASR